jgi:2-polyprenyl-3-methyl-5-hydroxy-6-metoxy-1,4-benzoquinol methylase
LYEKWISSEDSAKKRSVNNTDKLVQLRINELYALAKVIGKNTSNIKVLEYGMGWGDWLRTAHCLGFTTTGLEISSTRNDSVESSGMTIINDLSECDDNSFDLIYSNQVFEHLAWPKQVFAAMVKKLRPGVLICIKVPNGSGVHKKIGQTSPWLIKQIHPLEHINCYNQNVFKEMGRHPAVNLIKEPYNPTANDPLSYIKSNVKFIFNTTKHFNAYFKKH